MSNKRSNKRNVEDEVDNIETKAMQCAKLFLCKEGSKIPIKREDINKHLNTKLNVLRIINRAKEILKKVYGYNIVEIKKNESYIVVLDKARIGDARSPDPHQRMFLNAALTHIYMSGGQVSEDDLRNFLRLAKLIDNNNNLEWKKMFNLFVKQQYLNKSKGDNDNVVYKWGKRAEIEVPKMFVIKKMSEALGKNPEDWGEQYRIAKEQEEQSQQLQESQAY